jgi:ketosteroid isomerase-like protein
MNRMQPLVLQPGSVRRGTKALREWLASFAALRPKLNVTSREIIEGGDIALHCSAWTMNGTDPTGKPFEMKGRTADVLRKQPNGSWLVALDNPWGTAILPQ